MTKKQFLIFAVIVFLSIVFHLFNISKPARPVFDEVFFATFAASYVKGETPILDVHPPLGKLIYSIPLLFSKSRINDKNSVFLINEKIGNKLKTKPFFKPFDDFPYLRLRLVSGFFGV